jgi:hypothetical protein
VALAERHSGALLRDSQVGVDLVVAIIGLDICRRPAA